MATPHITDTGLGDGRLKRSPRSDLTREYVSGGQYLWQKSFYRALPFYIDDTTRDFGEDLYERMLLDAQVKSCVGLLKKSILSGGLSISAPESLDDTGYPQTDPKAQEIAQFCNRQMERLERPFVTETLNDMLDALALGNKVAEMVYEQPKTGPDAGQLCLKAVKVKPRSSTAFVVDAYQNLIGLIALIPGVSPSVLSSSLLVGKLTDVPNLLPRRKFAILTWEPQNGDPRGVSILRSAYNPWWLKQQTWPEYLKYLAQFGSPSLIGYTAEGAQVDTLKNADGSVYLDANNLPTYITPEQTLATSMAEFRNGTYLALPFSSQVAPLQVQGEGGAFLSAVDLFDRQMAKAILYQTLATEQAQHQARAASETHQDMLGIVVQYGKTVVEEMILNDILKPLIEYNFGEEGLEFLPNVDLGNTESQDFATKATAIASLQTAGYLTESQKPGIDADLGLHVRSPQEVQAAQDRIDNPPDLAIKAAALDAKTKPGQKGGME